MAKALHHSQSRWYLRQKFDNGIPAYLYLMKLREIFGDSKVHQQMYGRLTIRISAFLKGRGDHRESTCIKTQEFPHPTPISPLPLTPPTSLLSWTRFLDGRTGTCLTSSLEFRKSWSRVIALHRRGGERRRVLKPYHMASLEQQRLLHCRCSLTLVSIWYKNCFLLHEAASGHWNIQGLPNCYICSSFLGLNSPCLQCILEITLLTGVCPSWTDESTQNFVCAKQMMAFFHNRSCYFLVDDIQQCVLGDNTIKDYPAG